jgi:hypothetical protein
VTGVRLRPQAGRQRLPAPTRRRATQHQRYTLLGMGGTRGVRGNAAREVCFNGVDGIYYGSAHIQPTKQKTRIAPFLLPNVKRGHSVLKKN